MTATEAWALWLEGFTEAWEGEEPKWWTLGDQLEIEAIFREAYQAGYDQACKDMF